MIYQGVQFRHLISQNGTVKNLFQDCDLKQNMVQTTAKIVLLLVFLSLDCVIDSLSLGDRNVMSPPARMSTRRHTEAKAVERISSK